MMSDLVINGFKHEYTISTRAQRGTVHVSHRGELVLFESDLPPHEHVLLRSIAPNGKDRFAPAPLYGLQLDDPVSISPQGDRIGLRTHVQGYSCQILNANTGKIELFVEGEEEIVYPVAFSTKGNFAFSTQNRLHAYNRQGILHKKPQFKSNRNMYSCFSYTGADLGIITDNRFYVLNTQNWQPEAKFPRRGVAVKINPAHLGNFVYFPAHRIRIALPVKAQREIHVFDLNTGKSILTHEIEEGSLVSWLSLSYNGKQLAYVTSPSIPSSNNHALHLVNAETGENLTPPQALTSYELPISPLVFSPNGRYLYFVTSGDVLQRVEVSSGARTTIVQSHENKHIALFANSRYAVVSDFEQRTLSLYSMIQKRGPAPGFRRQAA